MAFWSRSSARPTGILEATASPTGFYGQTGTLFINWSSTTTSGSFRTANMLLVASNDTRCDTYFNGKFEDRDTGTILSTSISAVACSSPRASNDP